MKLFNLDSPLMQALNKMADLLWLNLLYSYYNGGAGPDRNALYGVKDCQG